MTSSKYEADKTRNILFGGAEGEEVKQTFHVCENKVK